jgi:valyl-tRNA synthetase
METAYDILFFWVARMIMMGLEDAGDVPFRTVYLHGLLRDERGEKMSKVRGNVLNPIDTIEQYGTDAMRFAVITGTSPGNDSKLTEVKLEAGRNFANKLWNATRFVVRSIETERDNTGIKWELLPAEDRWIVSRLNRVVAVINKLMEDFQFAEAQKQIYDFLWSEYCDWYIELAKIRLNSKDTGGISPLPVLIHVLETSLRLLHPYMPFITEELWQNLRKRLPEGWQETESIMVAAYPEVDTGKIEPEIERIMESVIEIVKAIRNVRAQHNVESSRWITASIYSHNPDVISPYLPAIETMSRAKPVILLDVAEKGMPGEKDLVMVLKEAEMIIPMASIIDLEAEKKRLEKEIGRDRAEFERLEARLKDNAFLSKAPAAVVEKEWAKLVVIKDKVARMQQELARLKS